jgi:hypothetical protein
VYGTGSFGPSSLIFCAGHLNGATDAASPGYCDPSAATSGNQFRFGVVTGGSFNDGYYIAAVGGLSVSFVDPGSPTAVTTAGISSGWVRSLPTNVTVSGEQAGLGIGSFSLAGNSGATIMSADLACYVNNTSPTTRRGVTSTTLPPCPVATKRSFDLSSLSFPEGLSTITGHAQSIVGVDTAAPASTLKLDTIKPTITPSGSLTGQDLAIPRQAMATRRSRGRAWRRSPCRSATRPGLRIRRRSRTRRASLPMAGARRLGCLPTTRTPSRRPSLGCTR